MGINNPESKGFCKYGFYDSTGKIVIPIIYDDVGYLSEGLISVYLNKKHGVIDREGKTVIPFEYEYISYFREGIAKITKNDKWGYINKYGKIVIPTKYEAFEDMDYYADGLRKFSVTLSLSVMLILKETNTGKIKGF